jgi:hypothetical protein
MYDVREIKMMISDSTFSIPHTSYISTASLKSFVGLIANDKFIMIKRETKIKHSLSPVASKKDLG